MTACSSETDRRIDGLGRILIPAEIRERLGISEGTQFRVVVRDGAIVLTPRTGRCPGSDHTLTPI
jgi:AbrB family looped-hinge helix DNA binding protein